MCKHYSSCRSYTENSKFSKQTSKYLLSTFIQHLLATKQSEQDIIHWCEIENRRYLFVYICDRLQENRAQRGTLQKNFFWHLQSCRRPDIELSKFYRRSLSRSHYNRPNRSLRSAWNNTFLRIDRSFLDIYARRVVPGFPVDGHICGRTYVILYINP